MSASSGQFGPSHPQRLKYCWQRMQHMTKIKGSLIEGGGNCNLFHWEKKQVNKKGAELRRSFNHGQCSHAFFFLLSNCLKIQYSNYVFSLHMKGKKGKPAKYSHNSLIHFALALMRINPVKEHKNSTYSTQVIELRNRKWASQQKSRCHCYLCDHSYAGDH